MSLKKCQLIIHDEVNCSFIDLEPSTRRNCYNKLKFFIHAARYTSAFILGRWDGYVSFFSKAGTTHLNLIDKVLPIIINDGYEIEIEDRRNNKSFVFPEIDENYLMNFLSNPVWPVGHPAEGKSIILRDYQASIIRTFTKNIQSVQSIATGAGKTIITATMSQLCEKYGRTIIIVPNKDLVKQTESDYKNLGLDVGVYFGDRKDYGKTHTICTWQSLDRILKTEEDETSIITMEKFIENVVCIIVDECHTCKAEILKKLLCGPFANIPIRWGLTGTIPKEEQDIMSLLVSIGPLTSTLAAKDLINVGVLAQCNINCVQMIDTVSYKLYKDEYNYLVTNNERIDWIGEFIKKISLTGNTLVLVNRISTGEGLSERIPGSTFVHGITKSSDRKETYDTIGNLDNQIIIASFGVASTGINLPRIFNLILIESGKSFVKVIQSIGRGLRKAQDKDNVEIYDICSTSKFSARHLSSRKKTYNDAGYPFNIKKIDYLTELSNDKIGDVYNFNKLSN